MKVRDWLRETFLEEVEPEPEVPLIPLPPEPMFRDPTGGDWAPLEAIAERVQVRNGTDNVWVEK